VSARPIPRMIAGWARPSDVPLWHYFHHVPGNRYGAAVCTAALFLENPETDYDAYRTLDGDTCPECVRVAWWERHGPKPGDQV